MKSNKFDQQLKIVINMINQLHKAVPELELDSILEVILVGLKNFK